MQAAGAAADQSKLYGIRVLACSQLASTSARAGEHFKPDAASFRVFYFVPSRMRLFDGRESLPSKSLAFFSRTMVED